MTNTGKLLIVGLLVIDAGIAGYLLFPKDDERTPSATSEVIGRITGATDSDAERGAAHIAGGNVMAVTPAPSAPPAGPVPTPAPSTTNQLAVMPTSPQPQPQTGALAQPPATATAAVPGLVAPDAAQAAAGRIDETAPNAAQIAAGASARSKQPAQSVAQQRAQSRALPGPRIDQAQTHRRDDTHPNGSNPVAAMLTDQLVKESAKPDPSLPMPAGVTVPLSQQSPPSPARTSPPTAGSAMTDQLVRESSRVTPMTQPAQPPILKPQ